MKKKKNKNKKIHRYKNFTPLAKEIVLNPWASKSTLRNNFIEYLTESTKQQFDREFIPIVNKHSDLLDYYSPLYGSLEDLLHRKDPQIYTNQLTHLKVLTKAFQKHSTMIQEFLHDKKKFEYMVLYGKYDGAIKILESSLQTYGYTFWYIQNKLTILSVFEEDDKLISFYEEISGKGIEQSFIFYLITTVYWISHTNTPNDTYDILIKGDVNTIREVELNWASSLIQYVSQSSLSDDTVDYTDFLVGVQHAFSVLDQYLYTRDWLISITHSISSNDDDEHNKKYLPLLIEHAEKLHNISLDTVCSRSNELLGINKFNPEFSDVSKKLIQDYSEGNYGAVIDIFLNHRESLISPESFILLFAKSAAYQGIQFDQNRSPLDFFANKLLSLLTLNQDPLKTLQEIESFRYKLQHHDWCRSIDATLFVLLKHYFFYKDNYKFLNACIFSIEVNPVFLSKLTQKNELFYIDWVEYKALTSGRKLRHELTHCEGKNFDKLNQLLESTDILKLDKISDISEFYLKHNQINNLVKFCVKNICENEHFFIFFPIKKIVAHLKRQVARETVEPSLEITIIYEIYTRYFDDTDTVPLAMALKKLLQKSNVKKPSDLWPKVHHYPKNIKRMFFKNICSENILDSIDCFESTSDLKSERLKIIEQLLSEHLIDDNEYIEEKQSIINSLITESTLANLSAGRIFVDKKKIENRFFNEAKLIKEEYSKISEDINFKSISDFHQNQKLTFEGSDKTSLIKKLIDSVFKAYLTDYHLGLEMCLSTQIRHNHFSDQVCSKLIKEQILPSEKHSNAHQYWIDKYTRIGANNVLLSELDEIISIFSTLYYSNIDQAKEWMKITFQDSSINCFNYSTFPIKHIENIIYQFEDINSPPKNTLNAILLMLDDMTENNLKSINHKLNANFRHKVNSLLDSLIISPAFKEFNDKVMYLKGELQEDINKVSSWFNFSKGELNIDMLNSLIYTSTDVFNSMKNNKNNFKLELQDDIKIESKHARPLLIALTNCYDNSVKYGINQQNTEIQVTTTLKANNSYTIQIQNLVSKVQYIANNKTNNLHENIMSLERMNYEGGTGLAKTLHSLKGASSNFHVDVVHNQHNSFRVDINYDP